MDIVVAVEKGSNILLLNNGSGVFSKSNVLSGKTGDSEDIAVADFNSDGHPDVLFVAEDSPINELYLGDGKGSFLLADQNIPIHYKSNAVIAEDVNGDGFQDVIVGNSIARSSPGLNSILINDGHAKFTDEAQTRLPDIRDNTQDLLLGDVNGDGYKDLVVANEGDNKLYFGRGDGTFSDESSRLTLRENVREVTREVCLGDVDGDGDLDIAFFNTGGDKQNRILINDGTGHFADETTERMPKRALRTWDGGLVDVNDDGHLDIISANSTSDVRAELFYVLINNGKGFFTDQTSSIFPPGVKESGWDVEAADLNNDGYLDFYLCGRSNSPDGEGSQDRLLFGIPGKATKLPSGN